MSRRTDEVIVEEGPQVGDLIECSDNFDRTYARRLIDVHRNPVGSRWDTRGYGGQGRVRRVTPLGNGDALIALEPMSEGEYRAEMANREIRRVYAEMGGAGRWT